MKVSIKPIETKQEEQVVIECVEVTQDILDIESYVLGKGDVLSGFIGERIFTFPLADVYYFEAVDEHCFAYTQNQVFEVKARLYSLEEEYGEKFFVRCSKSILVNLMKLDSISPALNGRFTAFMENGEQIIISRQYAKMFKKAVLGSVPNGI